MRMGKKMKRDENFQEFTQRVFYITQLPDQNGDEQKSRIGRNR